MRRGGGGARILASHLFFPLSRFFLGSEKAGAGGGGNKFGRKPRMRAWMGGWVDGQLSDKHISLYRWVR